MKKQNTILRLTVNVDYEYPGEVSLVRAFLRRMNILHAKSRPRSALGVLLDGKKPGSELQVGRERSRAMKRGNQLTSSQTPATTGENTQLALPAPPAKVEVKTQKFDPPKLRFRYIRLKEQRFEPPPGVLDSDIAAAGGGKT